MNYDSTDVRFTSEALKTKEQNPMKLLCRISENKALRFPWNNSWTEMKKEWLKMHLENISNEHNI